MGNFCLGFGFGIAHEGEADVLVRELENDRIGIDIATRALEPDVVGPHHFEMRLGTKIEPLTLASHHISRFAARDFALDRFHEFCIS